MTKLNFTIKIENCRECGYCALEMCMCLINNPDPSKTYENNKDGLTMTCPMIIKKTQGDADD